MIGRGGYRRSRTRRGLGQITCPPGETVDVNGFCAAPAATVSAPWYCNLPFTDALQACVQANNLALVSAPGLSAENKASLLQQFNQIDAQQCAAHPDECSAAKAVQNPCTLLFPSPLDQVFCDTTGSLSLSTVLLVGMGVVVLALLLR